MPKAIIHNPYWDSLGGGERYVATFARYLLDHGFEVDICWSENIADKIAKRFGIDVSACNFIPKFKSFGYDLVFWVSDGSLPLSFAKKTFIHFQFPFHDINGHSPLNYFKSRFYKFIVNSNFTKKFVDDEYLINSRVVYPPINITVQEVQKENVILYVGRFSNLTQLKHHDLLIEEFKKLNLKNWKLVLAGGVGVGNDKDYLQRLQNLANNTNVEFVINPNWDRLIKLYAQAKIFWSASGFGVDEQNEPLKVEHFGMTVVEAMAAGCVPIITNLGGHKEIIDHGTDGFLWDTTDQLISYTQKLTDDGLRNDICKMALQKCKMFSIHEFYKKLENVVGDWNPS